MLQKVLEYLKVRSNSYNYCCDILGNKIYTTQSDSITILRKVENDYALITSERGRETVRLLFCKLEEALLMTLLLLEKNRYFNKRRKLISNHIKDINSVMKHARDNLMYASPVLDDCNNNKNFYVENINSNYWVVFCTNVEKYLILNTGSDKLWAYQVAFNHSLKLDNYFHINKELIESHIISAVLGKEYLYKFLELNKYEICHK